MKVVILAGGYGTRLQEETTVKPKPMVEIGRRPILWHVMQIYAAHGLREFVIALGYKGELIKQYFLNYHLLSSSISISLADGGIQVHDGPSADWHVHLIDTGLQTMTGGRILRLRKWLEGDTFFLTYGDGVADIDIKRLLSFHRDHGRLATITAVRPSARFGTLEFEGNRVVNFREKQQVSEGWINGGFFVLEPGIFSYLSGDDEPLEGLPLQRLAIEGELLAYRHQGYWQCMDTLRDVRLLEETWSRGNAPWKVW